MRPLAIGLFALSLAAPLGAGAAAPAAPASEPLWKSVALAPGRIVGHGRFDAARPSYPARRASQKVARADAARAARCAGCPCGAAPEAPAR
jgi:hypothetical protein